MSLRHYFADTPQLSMFHAATLSLRLFFTLMPLPFTLPPLPIFHYAVYARRARRPRYVTFLR